MGNNHSTGFDLNLIICGRPSYNDVSILFGNEKNIINTEIEIKGKKFSIKMNKNLNWKFFIFPDNFNNEIKNNLFFLIENLCDINEKKNVLICYLTLNESKNLLEKFNILNENLPFFLFITNEFEKSELLTTNFNFLDKQKNSSDFNQNSPDFFPNSIDSNLIFTSKPSEIFPTILHICSYYNELGDSFCIPEFNKNSTEKNEKISLFNINFMICGESGVGKSALINILLNEKKSLSGIDFSTKKIIKYNHKHLNLSFYDTPGFIMGKNDEVKVCIEKINELQNGLSEEKNEIHVILYLINSQSGRTLKGIEIDFLRFLVDLNVKIYFVLTKVVDEQFKKEMENSIEFLFKDKKDVCNRLKEKIFMVDLQTKKGLVALLSDLYGEFFFSKVEIDVFNDFNNENNNEINNENNNEINNKNENNIKNENEIYYENKEKINKLKTLVKHSIFFKNLKTKSDFLLRKKALAYSLILSYALGNFIFNSNSISLGDSKTFVCSSLQIAMISSISLLYKKKITKSQISKKTIESLGIHISDEKIKIIIKEIVNFIKYLPFGEIINNIISGSVSGISTFVIGYNLVKKYEREIRINYEMNLFLEAIESFNDAVEGIKKLKERIYFETN